MQDDFSWVKDKSIRDKVTEQYRHIRAIMQSDAVNDARFEIFKKFDMPSVANMLGIDVGRDEKTGLPSIDLDNRQQLEILLDYAMMFDVSEGRPIRYKFIATYKESDKESLREMCKYLSNYQYAWLRPLKVKTGFGLCCEDLLTRRRMFLVDKGFSQTLAQIRNMVLFTGVHPFGDPELGCVMTGGAGMPVVDNDLETALEKILIALKIEKRPPLDLDERELARFVAASVNQAIRAGGSDFVRYE